MSAEEYYKLKVRPIYRSYPVYAKGREPAGYLETIHRLTHFPHFPTSDPRCGDQPVDPINGYGVSNRGEAPQFQQLTLSPS
jgi:hypothetical protein